MVLETNAAFSVGSTKPLQRSDLLNRARKAAPELRRNDDRRWTAKGSKSSLQERRHEIRHCL
jgi:hypothetical protein